MNITSLELNNFRNFKHTQINPSDNVNVIYGDNAQGKTNLLEAIWLFSGGHSFRGARESEFINFDSEVASIGINFVAQGYEQTANIKYLNGKKEISINNIPNKSSINLAQKLSAVVFSPEHLTLVKNGPAERRKFIDSIIARCKLKYAVVLAKFNKILQQRNALLKDTYKHPELKEILNVWDISLVRCGAEVVLQRFKYIKSLGEFAGQIHLGISNGAENLQLGYISSVKCQSPDKFDNNADFLKEYSDEYLKILQKNIEEDIRYGSTKIGPHHDDLDIKINSVTARNFGSQGQQRSVVISLKLAESNLIYKSFGEQPIIILDDVLSELDNYRQNFLINNIKQKQIFISCCEPSSLDLMEKGKVFRVVGGEVL